MSKRDVTAALLQVAGAAAGVVATWSLSSALGLMLAGVALIVFGVALERGR